MKTNQVTEGYSVPFLSSAQQLRFVRSSHRGPHPPNPPQRVKAAAGAPSGGNEPSLGSARVLATVGQHLCYDNHEVSSFWLFRSEDGNNHTVTESDAPDGADQRAHPRAPIALKVEYKRLNSFFADYTRNISKGGTFIRTERPLPIGTEFHFELTIPRLSEPLRLRGKVQWIVMPHVTDADTEPGMGIGFIYDSEAERERIEGVVEELMVQSLGPVLYEKLLNVSN